MKKVRLLVRQRNRRRRWEDEGHARRQGRRAGRDVAGQAARASRLHHFHGSLQHLLPEQQHAFRRRSTSRCSKRSGTLEERMGQKLGDVDNPLLVSVRSGAKFSMPGMMDTILNLGLNDKTVKALEAKSNNPRFAYDCYRRFIQMYGNVVLEIAKHDFDEVFDGQKKKAKAKLDTELTAEDLKAGDRGLQEAGAEEDRQAVPAGRHGAARGRPRRRVPLLVQRPRQALPQDEPDSRRPGHRRQRAGHGVRQHGRDFGHRRGLHAQSRPPARRSSTASSWRTRRAKTWWPASARRTPSPNWKRGTPRSTTSSAKSPTCWRSTTATSRISSSPSRTASSTCCRPATASARVRRRCASPWRWWRKA